MMHASAAPFLYTLSRGRQRQEWGETVSIGFTDRTMHYLFGITEAGAISRVGRSRDHCGRVETISDVASRRVASSWSPDRSRGTLSREIARGIYPRGEEGITEFSTCPDIVRSLNHEASTSRIIIRVISARDRFGLIAAALDGKRAQVPQLRGTVQLPRHRGNNDCKS